MQLLVLVVAAGAGRRAADCVNMAHLGCPDFRRATPNLSRIRMNTFMLGIFRPQCLAGSASQAKCCLPWIRPYDV